MSIISVRDVTLRFSGLMALSDVGMDIAGGRITALIGPNGAGKTTLFNVMCGFLQPDAGVVTLNGKNITGLSPQQVSKQGIVRSFQEVRVFRGMTVRDNLRVAAEAGLGGSASASATAQEVAEDLGLARQLDVRAADLSYAEQKFVSFGRVVATGADVVLLDEPSSGLDSNSAKKFARLVRELCDKGKTIVLVEHNLDMVRQLAEEAAFLHRGRLLAMGAAEEILRDKMLNEVYLGGGTAS